MSIHPARRAVRAFSEKVLATAALIGSLAAAACGPPAGATVDYLIVFELDTASKKLEELDFTVTYSGGGKFAGEGSQVDCSEHASADAAINASSFNDDDAGSLTIALTAVSADGGDPIAEGTKVVQCTFSASVKPTTGNFTIAIDKAKDTDGATVSDAKVVVVTPIEAVTSGSTSSSTTSTTITLSALEKGICPQVEQVSARAQRTRRLSALGPRSRARGAALRAANLLLS